VAKRLRISVGTLRTILQGKSVSAGTIELIAERLNVRVGQLILRTDDRWLTMDPEFYESLEFGYFLDHDRRAFGEVKWWTETVSITRVVHGNAGPPGVHFNGVVSNQWGNDFNVSGLLTNQFHFSLTGTHEVADTGDLISFDAAFSQQVDDVLCGTWSGINHFESRTTLFRIFLSTARLSREKIRKLTNAVRIETHFESHHFGYED